MSLESALSTATQCQSNDTCNLMAKEVIPTDRRIIAANFSNPCPVKKEYFGTHKKYSLREYKNRSFERMRIEQ